MFNLARLRPLAARLNLAAPARQSGAVLVLALLIVSLVTTLVVSASWKFGLSMARNENRWHGIQGRSYLESAEQVAAQILIADIMDGQTKDKDDRWEFWASPEGMQFPTDEGWIAGTLQDAQGLFNINLLALPQKRIPDPSARNDQNARRGPKKSKQPTKFLPLKYPYSIHQERFIRLLQTLKRDDDNLVDEEYAIALTEAVIDWVDGTEHPGETGTYGAEADYYDNLPIPIAISNQPMASISELSVIKGMEPLIYQQLLPLVIALPVKISGDTNGVPHININTMPPHLMTMFNYRGDLQPMPLEEIGPIIQEVMQELNLNKELPEGLRKIEDLTNSSAFRDAFPPIGSQNDERKVDMDLLGVASSYFIFNVQTQVGEQVRKAKVMLFRGGGKVTPIRRTDANF